MAGCQTVRLKGSNFISWRFMGGSQCEADSWVTSVVVVLSVEDWICARGESTGIVHHWHLNELKVLRHVNSVVVSLEAVD